MNKAQLIRKIRESGRVNLFKGGTRPLRANEARLVIEAIHSVWPDRKKSADLPKDSRIIYQDFEGSYRVAKITGYDLHHTKYEVGVEYQPCRFMAGGTWIFPNQIVQVVWLHDGS